MILITLTRNTSGGITSFKVDGHAGYADPGKDIVCAGVSAITVGTVNAIESLLQIRLDSSMHKGMLSASIPEINNSLLEDKVQLLLKSMVVMLQTIQQSYGKYIAIENITK